VDVKMEAEELKKYLRVTTDDEDEIVEGLQLAAEEYLTNAGIKKDYEKKLYKLAVKLLVSHWYENRMIQSEKTQTKLSFSLEAIIMQLQFPSDTVETGVSNESG
jgi:uncharacterized phage protein (predicted DNA packaging)